MRLKEECIKEKLQVDKTNNNKHNTNKKTTEIQQLTFQIGIIQYGRRVSIIYMQRGSCSNCTYKKN